MVLDSNPRPSEYESPPITNRPGLPPKPQTLLGICFSSQGDLLNNSKTIIIFEMGLLNFFALCKTSIFCIQICLLIRAFVRLLIISCLRAFCLSSNGQINHFVFQTSVIMISRNPILHILFTLVVIVGVVFILSSVMMDGHVMTISGALSGSCQNNGPSRKVRFWGIAHPFYNILSQ